MIDLRGIANSAIQAINPDRVITWRISKGWERDADYYRQPVYETRQVKANIQALSGADLAQIDGLNIQNTMRKVFMYGDVRAVSRPEAQGGDVLIFGQTPDAPLQTWLVTQVTETWDDWCCVIVTLQDDDTAQPDTAQPEEPEQVEDDDADNG